MKIGGTPCVRPFIFLLYLHLTKFLHVVLFFFQAEDGIRDATVTEVQTCALPISTVVVKERQEQPRLVVAQAALQLDQAGTFVLIVNPDNKVEMRRVTPGPQDGSDIVITDGLKQGEQVIVDGIQKVRVGQTVSATVQPPAGKGS